MQAHNLMKHISCYMWYADSPPIGQRHNSIKPIVRKRKNSQVLCAARCIAKQSVPLRDSCHSNKSEQIYHARDWYASFFLESIELWWVRNIYFHNFFGPIKWWLLIAYGWEIAATFIKPKHLQKKGCYDIKMILSHINPVFSFLSLFFLLIKDLLLEGVGIFGK